MRDKSYVKESCLRFWIVVYDTYISASFSDLWVKLLVFCRLSRRSSGLRKTIIYDDETRYENLFGRRLAIKIGRVFISVFVAWLSAFNAELFSFEKISYSAFVRRNNVIVSISSSSTLSFEILILIFVILTTLIMITVFSMIWALFIIKLSEEKTLD